MSIVTVKNMDAPKICQKEILRYAGVKEPDKQTEKLLDECLGECVDVITYHFCYCKFDVFVKEEICDFKVFKTQSKDLANNLKDCDKVLLFAATLGVGIDRLISKYSKISPAKALMFQAIGTERIEALCNSFCENYQTENGVSLKPRFSAGYGDLPLETQREIFRFLDCANKINLTLNDSLLMSPTKSVTAFIGEKT